MEKEEVERLVDLVLFGDIHEAPLSIIEDKINICFLGEGSPDEEAETRAALAATILQKYGE